MNESKPTGKVRVSRSWQWKVYYDGLHYNSLKSLWLPIHFFRIRVNKN